MDFIIIAFGTAGIYVPLILAKTRSGLQAGNVTPKQILAIGVSYAIVVAVWHSSTDLRAIIAYWIIILGLAITIWILKRHRPAALLDENYWSDNGLGEMRFLLPAIFAHLLAVVVFIPSVLH
jgi:hypothetical protein